MSLHLWNNIFTFTDKELPILERIHAALINNVLHYKRNPKSPRPRNNDNKIEMEQVESEKIFIANETDESVIIDYPQRQSTGGTGKLKSSWVLMSCRHVGLELLIFRN